MVDWNATVGADILSSTNSGKFRIGKTNDSGMRLLEQSS